MSILVIGGKGYIGSRLVPHLRSHNHDVVSYGDRSSDYNKLDLISHNLLVSFNYVCLLSSQKKNSLKILDWGGGIGHYGQIAKSSLPEIAVDYWCYDLEAFNKVALKEIFTTQQINSAVHF